MGVGVRVVSRAGIRVGGVWKISQPVLGVDMRSGPMRTLRMSPRPHRSSAGGFLISTSKRSRCHGSMSLRRGPGLPGLLHGDGSPPVLTTRIAAMYRACRAIDIEQRNGQDGMNLTGFGAVRSLSASSSVWLKGIGGVGCRHRRIHADTGAGRAFRHLDHG